MSWNLARALFTKDQFKNITCPRIIPRIHSNVRDILSFYCKFLSSIKACNYIDIWSFMEFCFYHGDINDILLGFKHGEWFQVFLFIFAQFWIEMCMSVTMF
jgi:hypothetical protein